MPHFLTHYRSLISFCLKTWLVTLVVASIAVDNIDPAAAAEFIPLGFRLGATESIARGLSDDGKVVAGYSGGEAFRWTDSTGIVGLGVLPGDESSRAGGSGGGPPGISGDGSTIVGASRKENEREAFIYNLEEGMRGLGGRNSNSHAASFDGKVVVGYSDRESQGLYRTAFRWTEEDGMVVLPNPEVASSQAEDVSDDGSVIVGTTCALEPSCLWDEVFRWTDSTGIVNLGFEGGIVSVSSDGLVLAGLMHNSLDELEAFRWTEETGAVGLGWLPDTADIDGNNVSAAYGIDGDGKTIVGYSGAGDRRLAFIWTEELGMHNLKQLLIDDYGLESELEGWSLQWPHDISANGRFIAGTGRNPDGVLEGWLVRLSEPVPEPSAALLALAGSLPLVGLRRRHRV